MWMNEWSHKNVKDIVSCHETFQCSKTVQVFHYFQNVMVYYGIKKCLLWNVQIMLKLKESENSLTKVQALRCVKIVFGWSDLRQKLGVLSCMNVMKHLLQTFAKWKNIFNFFSDLFASITYFVIMKGMYGLG